MPHKDPEARRRYHREYMQRYYADNPQKKAEHVARVGVNNKRYQGESRKWITEYLLGHPCVDCGQADIEILDFDHVRGKKLFGIAEAIRDERSLKSIISEVAKCDVRCANCHRKVTRQRSRLPSPLPSGVAQRQGRWLLTS